MQEEEKKGEFNDSEDASEKVKDERTYSYKMIPALKPISLAQIDNDSNESSSIFGGSDSHSPWAGRQQFGADFQA